MVVGTSLSGQDISMELVEVAKAVYLSGKSLDISEGLSKVISKHENLHLRPQVQTNMKLPLASPFTAGPIAIPLVLFKHAFFSAFCL